MHEPTEEELARCFNLGSDARLVAIPKAFNPFDDKKRRASWNRGWEDVHQNYGIWARWRYRPLPPVLQVA